MKQVISRDQWLELTDKQQVKALKWLKGRFENSFTIGMMIEFLDDDSAETCSMPIMIPASDNEGSWWRVIVNNKSHYSDELCDALWEAVKEVKSYE